MKRQHGGGLDAGGVSTVTVDEGDDADTSFMSDTIDSRFLAIIIFSINS